MIRVDWNTYTAVQSENRSKHFSSRKGSVPKVIVLHHTAGHDSEAYLVENADQVSTHVLIAHDGKIIRMVPDDTAAHTVGFSNLGKYRARSYSSPNLISLNIEIENTGNGTEPYTEAQYIAVAWQVRAWWKKYGYLPLVPHALIDTQNKTDPYRFDWMCLTRLVAQV